jgi:hypothetical protein
MIALVDYWKGRDVLYPLAMTPAIWSNAARTVQLVNQLLSIFGEQRGLTSGWRPPAVNANTPGASATSLHMTAEAADITDKDGQLDDWLMSLEGEAALVKLGLWHEHPSSTKGANGDEGWCHVQTRPPRSGNRHFYK